ncbi:MAG: hypothetical protein Sapg2KO_52390 [Saprospiraceae bacterium]
MNTIYKSIVLSLLSLLLNPSWIQAQCKLIEEVRVIRVQLDEGNNSGNGGFLELQTMAVAGSNKPTVDLRNFIVDDNNEARYNVGTNPGHIILGDCFKDLPIGINIIIYDDNNLHPSIDTTQDGWSADGQRLQVPFSDDCLIKMVTCPNPKDSRYCRETPVSADWKDIFSFRTEGDVLQVRNRITEVVQAVQWGNSEFSDGNEENTYNLAAGQCKFVGETIEVTYLKPVAIEVGIERQLGSFEHTVSVQIEGGLPPYQLSTNQAYEFKTDETFHQFTTQSATEEEENLKVLVISENGCRDELSMRLPVLEKIVVENCAITDLVIGKKQEDLLKDWACLFWSKESEELDHSDSEIRVSYEDQNGPTTYTLRTIDDKGNIIAVYEYLVVFTELPVSILGGAETICLGAGGVQTLMAVVEGVPAEDLIYEWSNGASTQSIAAMSDETYSVTVTHRTTNCIGSDETETKELATLDISFPLGNQFTLCPGQEIDIQAKIPSGYSADDYKMEWINAEESNQQGNSAIGTINTPGTYYLHVEDQLNGCTWVEEAIVEASDLTLPQDQPLTRYLCGNDPLVLSLAESYQAYNWSTGANTSSINVSQVGEYTLTVTNPDFCQGTVVFSVEDPGEDISTLNILPENPTFCPGTDQVLLLDNPPAWITGLTWVDPEGNVSNVNGLSITAAGTYELYIESIAGCTYFKLIEVEGEIEVSLAIEPEDALLCNGNEITIKAIVGENNAGTYSYLWSEPGETASSIFVAELKEYAVTVTNQDGCTGEAEIVPSLCLDDGYCMTLQSCVLEGYEFGAMQPTSTTSGGIIDFTDIGDNTREMLSDAITRGLPLDTRMGIIVSSESASIPDTEAWNLFNSTDKNAFDIFFWLHYYPVDGTAKLCIKLSDNFFGPPEDLLLLRNETEILSAQQQESLKAAFLVGLESWFDCGGYNDFESAVEANYTEQDNFTGNPSNCSSCYDCIFNCYNENWRSKGFLGVRIQSWRDTKAGFLSIIPSIRNAVRSLWNREIPAEMWKESGNTLLYMHPFKAGIYDAILQDNPVAAAYDMANLLVSPKFWRKVIEISTPQGQAELMVEFAIMAPELWQALTNAADQYQDQLCGYNGCEEMLHAHGRLIGGIAMLVLDVFVGTKGTAFLKRLLKEGPAEIANFFLKWADELKQLTPNAKSRFFNQLAYSFNCIGASPFREASLTLRSNNDLCDAAVDFLKHIYNDYGKSARSKLLNESSLLEAWQEYSGPNGPALTGGILNNFPAPNSPFYDVFESIFFVADNNRNFTLRNKDFLSAFLEDLNKQDLTDILKTANGVKAWEALFDFPNLRIDTEVLESFVKVKRIGSYTDQIKPTRISELTRAHGAPKLGQQSNIDNLQNTFSTTGYDISQPIPVVQLPDGTKLMIDGHHRLKAMENLDQIVVPVDEFAIHQAKTQFGENVVSDIVEISKLSGNYTGTYEATSGLALELSKDRAVAFMNQHFPGWN